MSRNSRKVTMLLKAISLGLLLFVFTGIPTLISAQKGEKKPEATKKITLRDAVTRKSPSKIQAKAGFELVAKSDSEIDVRHVSTKKVVGTVSCGSCPGGKCIHSLIGSDALCYALSGCDQDVGGIACTFNPF